MFSVFGGWRRKIAVLTLGLSCILTSLWLRSFSYRDRIDGSLPARLIHGYVISAGGNLSLIRRFPLPPEYAINQLHQNSLLKWNRRRWEAEETVLLGRRVHSKPGQRSAGPDCWTEFKVDWRVDFAGFHFGQGRHRTWVDWKVQLWTFPFWSLVFPWIGISAWLLFARSPEKPRQVPDVTKALPGR